VNSLGIHRPQICLQADTMQSISAPRFKRHGCKSTQIDFHKISNHFVVYIIVELDDNFIFININVLAILPKTSVSLAYSDCSQ